MLPCQSAAQTRVYKNYSVKDGLAGSTVYYTFQDKKGFMWFGTDQGLCRFDGTNFKNYTTRDGLPDNEVFRVTEDSMGRLWMICYNSRPCFMYHGVMHNTDNDNLLKKMSSETGLFKYLFVDREGRVWILGSRLNVVDKNKVQSFASPNHELAAAMGYCGNQIVLVTGGGVYGVGLKNDSFSYSILSKMEQTFNNSACFFGNDCYAVGAYDNRNSAIIKVNSQNSTTRQLLPLGINDIICNHAVFNEADTLLLVSAGIQGIKAFDRNLILQPDPYPFLPHDITYSYTAFDREGNTWVTSLGKGIFFIPADKTIQYRLNNELHNSNATSVFAADNGNLFVGFDHAHYGVLKGGKLTTYTINATIFSGKRVIRQFAWNKNSLIMGADYGVYAVAKDDPSSCKFICGFCVKNMVKEGEDSVLLGRPDDACRLVRTEKGFHLDSLWNVRTTAICKDHHGQVWLGSLSGLFVHDKGLVKPFGKSGLISKSRITDLLCDDYDNIWVATHQRGIFVITKDSIIAINSANGLPGDVCIRFFKESKNTIWVCTDRNVSKITFNNTGGFSCNISTVPELAGDVEVSVNDVSVDSANIWVATSDGLLQIEKANQKPPIAPAVYITSFSCSDSVFTDFNSPRLKYFQNNTQVDFIAVSYNSAGKIAYKYVLNNTSADTIYTRNTTVNFNALPPGKYSFSVWAKSIVGVWSESPATLDFEIAPPYWKTWWFITGAALLVIFSLTGLLRWRIRQIRMREVEKTRINKKIGEIELQAVRTQMNEHFIFNSLNSIQNFINQNNTEAANFYLANFGKLIRRTMDISAKPVISLQEEIDYLNNYLTLEKMRFAEKFDYSVTNEIKSVSPDELIFPSMILQPYVENAIRHGLRYKTEGDGKLNISFTEENGFIVCRIDDNGIGRKKSEELKSKTHVEYQSKGIRLSEDKVYLFNQVHDNKIRVEVEDKKAGLGTLVKVYVPLKINL
ncbi:MAG: putative signal transduction histidine kinase [Bacteroidota bacterium]|nr:putative signal transduction histidine kinase [Bacteroidota bacterium]